MSQSTYLSRKRQMKATNKAKAILRAKLRAEKKSNYYDIQLNDNFEKERTRSIDISKCIVDHFFHHDTLNFDRHYIRRQVSLSIEINNKDIMTKNTLWLDFYQHILEFCDIFDFIKIALSCSHLYNFIMNSNLVSFENALRRTNKFHLTQVLYSITYQNPKLIIKLDSLDYFSQYYSRYNEHCYDRMEILLLDIEFHRNYIHAFLNEENDQYLITYLKYGLAKVRFNSYIVQRILIEEYGISQRKIEYIISSILCLELRVSIDDTNSIVIYSEHILRSLLISLSFKSNSLINYKKKYSNYIIKQHCNAFFIDCNTFTTYYCTEKYSQYYYKFLREYNMFYVVTINNVHYFSTNNAIIYTNNLTNSDIWDDISVRFQVVKYNLYDMSILHSNECNGVHLSFNIKPEFVQEYLCRCGLLSLFDTDLIKQCPSYYACNSKQCQCFYKKDLGAQLIDFCCALDIIDEYDPNYNEWVPFGVEKIYMNPQVFITTS